ncbi:MAG: amino acid decarboxylase [Planctomycetes bacterium]|nr:amino acid decarboxylase [Planctomycetota bacterium]
MKPSETDAPGDMPAKEFRAAAHEAADLIADYLEGVGAYPVLPKIVPGDVRRKLPSPPPEHGEAIGTILGDYKTLIEPNVTHWNHPGFMAYFAITGSGPGVLGEALAAGLNVNAMLWRTGPAPTELEETVCDWLRQMLALPPAFKGHINDTASISTMLALAAARHRLPGLEIRERGMAGRSDLPPLIVYCSDQAHSSVEKAAIALGFGMCNVRKIPCDDAFRMRLDALAQAVTEDCAAGRMPVAVVATAGTTSTTSVDPLRGAGELCKREKIWLHVDAAYAGSACVCPEFRALLDGLELADSIVVNPHKWLFTPVDCSVLFAREPQTLRDAFSLVPEYLRTADNGATNLMDYGVQLGRRFRSLKLWMVIRYFGVEGLRARIRAHVRLAQAFKGWVEREPEFELCAPAPFSTVCFRYVPTHLQSDPEAQDRFNERLLAEVNAQGPVFLSHTKLRGRIVLRLTVGNLRTQEEHLKTAWRLIREAVERNG